MEPGKELGMLSYVFERLSKGGDNLVNIYDELTDVYLEIDGVAHHNNN